MLTHTSIEGRLVSMINYSFTIRSQNLTSARKTPLDYDKLELEIPHHQHIQEKHFVNENPNSKNRHHDLRPMGNNSSK